MVLCGGGDLNEIMDLLQVEGGHKPIGQTRTFWEVVARVGLVDANKVGRTFTKCNMREGAACTRVQLD